MAFRLIIVAATMLFSSCYVEEATPRQRVGGKGSKGTQLTTNQTSKAKVCSFKSNKGCFEGQIASAPNIIVEGQVFHDADELSFSFDRVIDIENTQGESLERGKNYEIKLLTPFDNSSFSDGFEAFLKGQTYKAISVRSKGKILLNDLVEGEYKLRVQRPIKFSIIVKEGDTVMEEKTFCASLYQDILFEVYVNEKVEPMVFDEFNLYISNVQCDEMSKDRVITL